MLNICLNDTRFGISSFLYQIDVHNLGMDFMIKKKDKYSRQHEDECSVIFVQTTIMEKAVIN